MGFWGWVGLIFFAIVGWNLIQWGIRVSDEAKAEEEARANQKKIADAKNEMERIRNEFIRDLNKNWNKNRSEYVNALQSGDSFLASAKGRDFYSCNRRYRGNGNQSQVIADEIRIKNEIAKGKSEHVNSLGLEELDNEELRDRLEFLTK